MTVKLLSKQLLEFLSSKGDYTGSSESTLVKMQHCSKSHVTAHSYFRLYQLWGDYILFKPEGEGSSVWCGRPKRNCLACMESSVGDAGDEKCASRLVNTDLAASLTRLAKLVEAEWGNSKPNV